MNTTGVSGSKQPKRVRLPHWATPIFLIVLFLLVHIVAPWGFSLLSNRYGWVDGRPGRWNLLALILVGFLLFFAFLNFVAVPYEERDLERRFGEAYRQYKQTVPRWLGRIRR